MCWILHGSKSHKIISRREIFLNWLLGPRINSLPSYSLLSPSKVCCPRISNTSPLTGLKENPSRQFQSDTHDHLCWDTNHLQLVCELPYLPILTMLQLLMLVKQFQLKKEAIRLTLVKFHHQFSCCVAIVFFTFLLSCLCWLHKLLPSYHMWFCYSNNILIILIFKLEMNCNSVALWFKCFFNFSICPLIFALWH